MKNPPTVALGIVFGIAGLIIAAVVILRSGSGSGGEDRLPAGVEVMAASDDAEIRGQLVCGTCALDFHGECGVVIWDRDKGHLVKVLPSQQLGDLLKLMGT
ncbi:MAG: hypothetical protein ABIP94_06265 [Planctomycetota bacterium]